MAILLKPIITEKMNSKGEKLNQYAFLVDKNANKLQIREAVESMYGVVVESVNTMRYGGKRKSRYTRSGVVEGKRTATKRAVVTLTQGDTIDFFSAV